MVIVGGGDGSLSSSDDHFLGQDTVFAILPLGTANSFARTLGVPLDLDGAIEMRIETRPRLNISIDGEVTARTPVTVSVARGAIEVAAPLEE